MNGISLLFLLVSVVLLVHSYHIIPEERYDKTDAASIAQLPDFLPPISIIDLRKSSRRVSRTDAERNTPAKKKVIPKKKPRASPPPNCVPLKSSCKPPAPPCCEPCAFCHCHLFRSVCVYKMGYPNC
ncbi:agouti-signaling protein-like [Hyperolius riggenbachi]|uniref:agouti-signaling protein-like n=1 Tax=Hyperolius riggenbachi TaxID=752182 RepID=UPI0035A3AA01